MLVDILGVYLLRPDIDTPNPSKRKKTKKDRTLPSRPIASEFVRALNATPNRARLQKILGRLRLSVTASQPRLRRHPGTLFFFSSRSTVEHSSCWKFGCTRIGSFLLHWNSFGRIPDYILVPPTQDLLSSTSGEHRQSPRRKRCIGLA